MELQINAFGIRSAACTLRPRTAVTEAALVGLPKAREKHWAAFLSPRFLRRRWERQPNPKTVAAFHHSAPRKSTISISDNLTPNNKVIYRIPESSWSQDLGVGVA